MSLNEPQGNGSAITGISKENHFARLSNRSSSVVLIWCVAPTERRYSCPGHHFSGKLLASSFLLGEYEQYY